MTPSLTPRFTGIFIPVEILEIKSLSFLEKFILSWIDALYCKNHGGCYASDEQIAKRLNVKENTIAKALTKLRKLNFIENVSFDGRKRVIRAKINEFISESQSKAGLDYNPGQGWTTIQGRVGQKSKAGLDKNPIRVGQKSNEEPLDIIYESKGKVKKSIAQSANRAHEQRVDFSFSKDSGKFEGITNEDLSDWKSAYSEIDISKEIIKAEQWLKSNPSKAKKKLWRKFLVTWLARTNDKAENQKAYRFNASQTIDRRTKNMDGTPISSPAEELF